MNVTETIKLPVKELRKFKPPSSSYWRTVWKEFSKSWLSKIGLFVVLSMVFVACFAPFLSNDHPLYLKVNGKSYFPVLTQVSPFKYWMRYPVTLPTIDELKGWKTIRPENTKVIWPPISYSPTEYDLDSILSPPSSTHWLGTDEQGRDVASRIIYGARISLSVGIVAVSIYLLIGIFLGAISGYYGGKIDMIISRFTEVMICFPTFFLILAVLAFVGPSIYNIMFVIGITGWTGIARLVRGEFLKQRQLDYVAAVQIQGASSFRILFRHILPNAIAPVFVSATFGIASSILIESSLSFLGFGVQPPTPSWGDILSQSKDFIDFAWWLALFPGLALFLTITSYNLVGEGLRDALDPKLRQ